MCKPWIGRGRGHGRRPGGSGRKSRKRTCGCSAWGGMCSQGHCRRICTSGKARSGVGRCSGRGRTVGGEHSRANAHDAGCLVVPSPSTFSMKYQLVQYLVSALCIPTIGPLRAADIINFCGKKDLHYHRIEPTTCPTRTWNHRDNNHCTTFPYHYYSTYNIWLAFTNKEPFLCQFRGAHVKTTALSGPK